MVGELCYDGQMRSDYVQSSSKQIFLVYLGTNDHQLVV